MRISDWSSDVCSSDLFITRDAVGVGLPARKLFVDDLDLGKTLGADRRHFDWLAVDLVAGADADHVEIIEHVELGHAQAGDAVVEDRAPRGNRIEPADRKSTRLNSSHSCASRMPSSA